MNAAALQLFTTSLGLTPVPPSGWGALDVTLVTVLPFLIALSAFFSGSETALFGMTEHQRMTLRRAGSLAGRAIDSLQSHPRHLLITILLGNMTVNVFYFVISSVLMLRGPSSVLAQLGMAISVLLIIVLFGEVLPKMIANSHRIMVASFTAPLLLALHRVTTPLRVGLDTFVVAPLSRLTRPTDAPPQLDESELKMLLHISGQAGVIDSDEQRLLHDVLDLSRLRVREVMTPRVRMHAVARNATRREIVRLTREFGLTQLPVFRGTLDTIVGMLHVKGYLLDSNSRTAIPRHTTPASYVPHMATLDQLLDHFRQTHSRSCIVVDEFGGTAGIVTLADVIERVVGELTSDSSDTIQNPQMIGPNRWKVDGNMSVHDWADAFGHRLVSPRVATLGGLITEKLGRVPAVGETVVIGNIELKATEIRRSRVVSAEVRLLGDDSTPQGGVRGS